MNNFELTAIFCHVDDFCKHFESEWDQKLLASGIIRRKRRLSLSLSEVMTILMAFHFSGARNFKRYYLGLLTFQRRAFPGLVSYSQFVTLMKRAIIPLTCFIVFYSPECGS